MDPEHDPVFREINRLRASLRRQLAYTLVVSLALLLALAGSLWIRSNDLQAAAARNAGDQVSSCFDRAAQRQLLLEAARDPALSGSVRSLVRTLVERTPTVAYCRGLARSLGVHPITERNP